MRAHGTDTDLARLLASPGKTDVEAAKAWLGDALGCLDEPHVGNAQNQTWKALVALGWRPGA